MNAFNPKYECVVIVYEYAVCASSLTSQIDKLMFMSRKAAPKEPPCG